ncbi:MAG: MFS transporter [Gammaproteobacteria bacterium]|nr:MFS transporter [Gammaproteobacteria bacterium]MDH3407134.1 MFS transporter [Gammaproteobacteria bacterium]MDH5487613.1 MFS transporter [Gammaproteobacteria bacterium]
MPSSQLPRSPPPLQRWLTHLVSVEAGEWRALCWSFAYFFALLCGYYILRPVRDAMGIAGGVQQLQWLFTATFVAMLAAMPLYGWVTSRFPRRRFLPYVYYFFIANLLLFHALFEAGDPGAWVARAFFIWASVYNLFVVSVFWSFMADLYSNPQARRLFGFIAAGGTTGALAGPALTAVLAVPLGTNNLLLVSAAFLAVAVLCIHRLIAWRKQVPAAQSEQAASEERAMGGGILAGIRLAARSPYLLGICLLMLLFTTLSTFIYFQQAQIVRDSFVSSAERTAVFAAIDLAVNSLTILLQVFLTARIVRVLGVGGTLALIPLLLAAGFTALGMAPVLAVLVVVQVLRRAGEYAITRPAREMLYVVLAREEKYKAKNFIDTVVYRGGDAVSAWAYAGLRALGLGLGAIAFIAVPLALAWAWVAFKIGRRQEALAARP